MLECTHVNNALINFPLYIYLVTDTRYLHSYEIYKTSAIMYNVCTTHMHMHTCLTHTNMQHTYTHLEESLTDLYILCYILLRL